jgi:YD repeat-containing protein
MLGRSLRYEALEDRQLLAAVTWDSGGDGTTWNDPLNWSGDTLPGPADDVTINVAAGVSITHSTGNDAINSLISSNNVTLSGGTLSISTASAINASLTFSGGTLSGAGDLTVNGALNWTSVFFPGFIGGTMSGAGQTIIAAGGMLNLSGNGAHHLNRTLVNNGTANWTGGELQMNGGTLQNNGNFTVNSDNFLTARGNGGINAFNNVGTFIKQGSGTVEFTTLTSGVSFNNTGNVDVQQGTLELNAGGTSSGAILVQSGTSLGFGNSYVYTAGSTLSGVGAMTFKAGDHSFSVGQFTPTGTVNITGATMTFGAGQFNLPGTVNFAYGTLSGTGDLTISGTLNWTSGFGTTGTMNGTGQTIIAAGGTLNLSGNGAHQLNRMLVINGTANWTGGELQMNGGTLQNNGSFTVNVISDSFLAITGNDGINAFNNAGDFVKQGSGTVQIFARTSDVAFNNTGSVDVRAGTLELNSSGELRLDDPQYLSVYPSSTVRLTNNLRGTTRNADLFSQFGRILFESAGLKTLEVMSRDLLGDAGAFIDNFVYDTIELASGVTLQLVDESDNATGPGAEAIYLNNLIIPDGATLDLNGLKVYARATLVGMNASVINGTINSVESGGQLTFAQPISGQILSPREVDEWTYYGRAGRSLTVFVNPGALQQPAPLPPALRLVKLDVVGPDDSVLASIDNVTTGIDTPISLLGFNLPKDGTYRLRVGASPTLPEATGKYILSAYDSTFETFDLLPGRQVVGAIDSPYSQDHWTFSAVADSQVQFDLVNRSNPNVVLTLTGPDGFVGFTDLGTDSGLVNLPSTGQYTLFARGLEDAIGTYAFKLIQTTQQALPLATPTPGTLAGDGAAVTYKLTAPGETPLLVSLDHSADADRTELYVRRGSSPTRSEYDYRYATSNAADHSILVPNASAGDWYVLVYGDRVAVPADFTLTATSSKVHIFDVTPDSQPASANLSMTIHGAGFLPGAQVSLIGPGASVINARAVDVDSFSQITATFDLTGAPLGSYSVTVSAPGGSDTLTDAFTALDAGQPRLETRLIMPAAVRGHWAGGRETFLLEYANVGNAPMPAPLLLVRSADGSDRPILTMDGSRFLEIGFFNPEGLPPGASHEVLVLGSGAQAGVLNPGERFQVPIYYIRQQEPLQLDGEIEMEIRYWTADDATPIDWAARKESSRPPSLGAEQWDVVYANLTDDLDTTGDYVRMLGDNAQYLGRLGQRVVDVDQLWNFEILQAYGLSPVSTLDAVVDASLPAPGVTLDFARRYSNSLNSRYSVGPFGRGWFTPWQAFLSIESDGDIVRLVGEGGSARLFTRHSGDGSYFSGVGDSASLVQVGNVYELRTPGGVVTRFRSDGRIDYVQDTNGNRVTAGWNPQNQLTSLAHTSGASLTIAYNVAGHVASVTDSAGRATTYGYDATDTYLTSATTGDGKVTTYTYHSTGPAAMLHVLTSITRGGTTQHFVYDERGRLDEMYRTGNAEFIDFEYDTAGTVSLSDDAGTSRVYFDHNGLIARTTDALGYSTTAEFDGHRRLSKLITPTGESQSFTWCTCGSLTSSTDELGHTTKFEYNNPFKRMTGFTDAKGNFTMFNSDYMCADGLEVAA